MLEIRIPEIKVISQNQKIQVRAMFRKGTREALQELLNTRSKFTAQFSPADMQAIMSFLFRKMIGMLYNGTKYKQFESNLKIEILKAHFNKKMPRYKKNVQVLIAISTYLDIDNPVKGIIDVLCKLGIIENDRDIIKLKIIKTPTKRGRLEALIIKIDGDL